AMKNADNINKLKSSIESTNEAVVKLQETAEKTVYVLTALQDYSGGSGGIDISIELNKAKSDLEESKEWIRRSNQKLDSIG
uniref:Fusion glycoprotein F0, linker, Fusion glycoprotein F0 n=1 Tax=Henipavirus hendraense TaxID=3052223 RepID=UPI00021472DB|nr:Chain A, Fusion glycoprotein F0, linker, Fusion glycoprotein F0 [synthetic construct]3N27_B Chain B, Fusion glycoprotein F0, linker, Fusion glycoprotein F0 [synthetic construct]3N27_C Chain C, Fusion glycoprotein F0, linker, Fusion glycoprotein F0 [synthetic construct]